MVLLIKLAEDFIIYYMHDFVQDIPSTWNPLFSSHPTPSLLNIEIRNFIIFKVCFTPHLLQLTTAGGNCLSLL